MRSPEVVTAVDQAINRIVDTLDAGDLEGAKQQLHDLPYGLVTVDEARIAMAKAALIAFDGLNVG
jgi:hypothetical protein